MHYWLQSTPLPACIAEKLSQCAHLVLQCFQREMQGCPVTWCELGCVFWPMHCVDFCETPLALPCNCSKWVENWQDIRLLHGGCLLMIKCYECSQCTCTGICMPPSTCPSCHALSVESMLQISKCCTCSCNMGAAVLSRRNLAGLKLFLLV